MIPIAAMYLLTLNNHWIPEWDSVIYISLAKSLAAGEGYKYTGFFYVPYPFYPFAFPLLLSPTVHFFGVNFLLMRLLIVIMGICSIGLVYLMFRELFKDRWLGISIMLLTACSYSLLSFTRHIMSEVPYLFFSLLSIIFIDKYRGEKSYLTKNALIGTLFLLLTYFTRMAGISLVGASVLSLFFGNNQRKNLALNFKKAGLVGLIFIIFASAWMIRNHLTKEPFLSGTKEGLGYRHDLISVELYNPHSETIGIKDFSIRIRDGISYYGGLLPRMVVQRPPRTFLIAKLLTLFIILWGFIYCSFKRRGISEYYFFLYITMYILWPHRIGSRFLIPLIPFIFYYFITGIREALNLLASKISNQEKFAKVLNKPALTFIVFALIFYYLPADIKIIKEERTHTYYTKGKADFMELIKWVKENTPPEAVIISNNAQLVYFLSQRKTFFFPWGNDKKEIMKSIYKYGIDYAFINPGIGHTKKYLLPIIQSNVNRFELVHQNESGLVYRVKPEG